MEKSAINIASSSSSSSSSSSDGNSAMKSDEKSEKGEDEDTLDHLPPSLPSSGTDKRSECKALEFIIPESIVPEPRVPGLSDSGVIATTEPSSSAATNPLENVIRSNIMEPSREINHGLNMNILPDNLMRGVKRKFLGNHYEAKNRKRQKIYHYKNTVGTGGRKRKIEDDSDHIRKRLKTSSENGQSAVEVFVSESKSGKDSENTASGLEATAQSAGETSCIAAEDDYDALEETQPCSRICVCQAGPSRLPMEVERRFDTPESLYKACLLRRTFSSNNTEYLCCKKRCMEKYSREKVMQKCLLQMSEDNSSSDMSVHDYL